MIANEHESSDRSKEIKELPIVQGTELLYLLYYG